MSDLQLEAAAAVLGPILEEVIFVGGATVHLWITDTAAPPVRATEDVDVICEVASRTAYYRLGERLRRRGLREAADEPVLCRWRSDEPSLVLDVMPTDPKILGFSNRWYEEAIATAENIALASGVEIRATRPPQLIATKLCAWKSRGKGDLLRSLDVHDVITLLNGRAELVDEIESSDDELRDYIATELAELRKEPYFEYAIEGALAPYGPVGAQRANLVRGRLIGLVG